MSQRLCKAQRLQNWKSPSTHCGFLRVIDRSCAYSYLLLSLTSHFLSFLSSKITRNTYVSCGRYFSTVSGTWGFRRARNVCWVYSGVSWKKSSPWWWCLQNWLHGFARVIPAFKAAILALMVLSFRCSSAYLSNFSSWSNICQFVITASKNICSRFSYLSAFSQKVSVGNTNQLARCHMDPGRGQHRRCALEPVEEREKGAGRQCQSMNATYG